MLGNFFFYRWRFYGHKKKTFQFQKKKQSSPKKKKFGPRKKIWLKKKLGPTLEKKTKLMQRYDFEQASLTISCVEDIVGEIVRQSKRVLAVEPHRAVELFFTNDRDGPLEYWSSFSDFYGPNYTVAMACMAMQDLMAYRNPNRIHFCEHEPHEEDVAYESEWDKSWFVYADDFPIVIYWEDERRYDLPSPGHYTYTIFHKSDRGMDRLTGTGIKNDESWGPKYRTWMDKVSPVRELVDKYIGFENGDFVGTRIHEIFLARRFAIAQIKQLPGDVLRKLSDMDHVCNLVGDSLRKRGCERYFRVEDMWPHDEEEEKSSSSSSSSSSSDNENDSE